MSRIYGLFPILRLMKCRKYGQYLSLACVFFCAAIGEAQKAPADDVSGMYSFLREGEFVQITVEVTKDATKRVTGFVSRFGDSESDKGAFLDHFFSAGSLEGDNIHFVSKVVHDISFEFSGRVERGRVKSRAEEGYFIITGTLTQNNIVDGKTASSKSRELSMKMFPELNDTILK